MIEKIIDILIDINLRAAVIIGVVLLMRMLFEKLHISRKYTNMLWLLPFLCLVMPWRLESDVSFWGVFPINEITKQAENHNVHDANLKSQDIGYIGIQNNTEVSEKAEISGGAEISNGSVVSNSAEILNGTNPYKNTDLYNNNNADPFQSIDSYKNLVLSQDAYLFQNAYSHVNTDTYKTTDSLQNVATVKISKYNILFAVWVIGITLIALYSIISYVRLRRKIVCSYCVRDNIYYVDDIETPFVFGIIRPRIYIPSLINPEDIRYVLEHEQTHIFRKDHLKKIAAYIITVIHWFSPMVWVAFYCLGKDIEMACDEETVSRIGLEKKQDYAHVLLKMAAGKNILKSAGIPVAFGEGDTKSRIKNVLKYRRTVKVVALGAVAVIAVLCAILLTDPRSEQTVPEFSEEITITSPEMSETTVGGADAPGSVEVEVTETTIVGPDGPILDYASEDMIIFHDGNGLIVYHREKDILTGVNLEPIGLAATQGDNACEVLVSKDGLYVYMYVMKEKKHMYVYDVRLQKLYKQKYDMTGVDVFECNRYDGEIDYLNYLENEDVKHYLDSEDGKTWNMRWKAVDSNTQEIKWDIAIFKSSEIKQFTMETLIDLCDENKEKLGDCFSEMVKYEMAEYSNFEHDEDEESLTSVYTCTLPYNKKIYKLEIYYWKADIAGEYGYEPNEIDIIRLSDINTGDAICLYEAGNSSYSYGMDDIHSFLAKKYDISQYVEIDLPDGVKLGEYERCGNDIWDSCVFEGNFEEIPHGESCSKPRYGAGGIGMVKKEVYDIASFKNGKLNDVTVLYNHGVPLSEIETVDGCDMQALMREYAFDVFVGTEKEEYMKKNGLTGKEIDEIAMSQYWYIHFAEPDSEYVYLLYLNKQYFSKDEAIALARTMVFKEGCYINHHKTSDGMWETDDGRIYKYRLKISGRLPKAASDTTYIILSNRENITFDQAWKAGGLSSNKDDYFKPEEAVVVGIR